MIDKGKFNVLGVMVDAIDYAAATDKVLLAAREQRPFALTALAVHGVMTGVADPAHNARLNSFDVVTPDGQPVRWGLKVLHGIALADRVYGPTLTLHVLERCAAEGVPVYLYGSTDETLAKLVAELQAKFSALKIAGTEPSKFRAAEPGEDHEIAERIRASGARVLLVGLGCPRQEGFAYAMRPFSTKKVPSRVSPVSRRVWGSTDRMYQNRVTRMPRGVSRTRSSTVPVPPLMITFPGLGVGSTPFLAAQTRS